MFEAKDGQLCTLIVQQGARHQVEEERYAIAEVAMTDALQIVHLALQIIQISLFLP